MPFLRARRTGWRCNRVLVTAGVLQVAVLGCKAALAVLLVAAGGAKLADVRGFGASVRLFVRWRPGVLAGAVAAGELAIGAASLALPLAWWLNVVVLAVCASFLAVSAVGYVRYRGRPCRCFGALSGREFSAAGVGRAALLVLAAVIGLGRVPALSVRLGLGWEAALLAGAVLVAGAAFSAAVAAGASVRSSARSSVRSSARARWA